MANKILMTIIITASAFLLSVWVYNVARSQVMKKAEINFSDEVATIVGLITEWIYLQDHVDRSIDYSVTPYPDSSPYDMEKLRDFIAQRINFRETHDFLEIKDDLDALGIGYQFRGFVTKAARHSVSVVDMSPYDLDLFSVSASKFFRYSLMRSSSFRDVLTDSFTVKTTKTNINI